MENKKEITKLTSVKILKGTYSNFKKASFDGKMSLQTLVNRTLERYITDAKFKMEMDEFLDLQCSGSQY